MSITVAGAQGLYKAPKELLVALHIESDGKTLLCGGLRLVENGNDRSFVTLRDLAMGKQRELFQDSLPRLTALALAPDGQTLALATVEKEVTFWRVER